jgi:hypothetical protein
MQIALADIGLTQSLKTLRLLVLESNFITKPVRSSEFAHGFSLRGCSFSF